MNFLKIGLAALFGFVLGAILFHTPTARAAAQATTHVFIVPVWMPDAKTPQPSDLSGARIAGISCVPKPLPNAPDATVCYVATTN